MIRLLALVVLTAVVSAAAGCGDSSPRVGAPKEAVPPPDFKKTPVPKGDTAPGPP